MSYSKSNYATGILMIIMTLLLVVSFLIISISYFNTKEIGSLISQCQENGGEETLEIHSNLTSKYSFECRELTNG